eukprot:5554404-Pleurochrysis_carterae.AAC.4
MQHSHADARYSNFLFSLKPCTISEAVGGRTPETCIIVRGGITILPLPLFVLRIGAWFHSLLFKTITKVTDEVRIILLGNNEQ